MSSDNPLANASPTTAWSTVYPDKLRAAEEALLLKRREKTGETGSSRPLAGLAISGGGIRSATFNLGLLQALARSRALRRFDFLSTVSGGGYIGGFLGAWIQRCGWQTVENELPENRSAPVQFLRENGRYLSPNGSGDLLAAAAAHVRNGAAVLGVIGLLLFTGFLALCTLRAGTAAIGGVWQEAASASGGGGFFWSPVFALSLAALALIALPLGTAYWWVGKSSDERPVGLWVMLMALTGGAGVWAVMGDAQSTLFRKSFWLLPALTLLAAGYAIHHGKTSMAAARRWLTSGLAAALVTSAFLGAVALIDSLGETLLNRDIPLQGAALGAPLLAVAPRLRSWFSSLAPGRIKIILTFAAWLAALLVATTALTLLSYTAHALAGSLGAAYLLGAAADRFTPTQAALLLTGCTVASLLLSAVVGNYLAFINLSSHQQLYSARLTRAYLGASNPKRTKPGLDDIGAQNVTWVQPGDQIPMEEYRPHEQGGPLHLVNVTVNETIHGKSQLEQRDRKGLPLAVGPAGISVGRRDHGLYSSLTTEKGTARLEPPGPADADRFNTLFGTQMGHTRLELPPLGNWIGISGAAFSTGLGSRTTLAYSFLAAFFNVRLGYWWDSGIDPARRAPYATKAGALGWAGALLGRLFPAQAYLFDEFLARFHGPARRHWCLTDGGHFENTATYELLRRRVPLIVVSDCGCDDSYVFDDLTNLVRKARIDFGAEIEFFDREALAAFVAPDLLPLFGTLDELRVDEHRTRAATPRPADQPAAAAAAGPRPVATLAWVNYGLHPAKPRGSLLLVVKPALTGREPLDIVGYARAHPKFPQQSTVDQFFDEAQWESYRKLGEIIGGALFSGAPTEGRGWRPASLSAT